MPPTASITGIADTPVGKLAEETTLSLAAAAASDAVADAGLDWERIDGLLTTPPLVGAYPRQAQVLAETFGIAAQLRHCGTVSLGGASTLNALMQATTLVESGTCQAVLYVAADTPRTGQRRDATVGDFAAMRHPLWEQPYGLTNVAAYALVAQAYLWRHELPADALADIAVAMRSAASSNPTAVYREPLTHDDVTASRMVSSPLRLLECSPICDGAGAFVVTKRGPDTGRPPVLVTGEGVGARYDSITFASDLADNGAAESAAQALESARVDIGSVDVALLYDSYSVAAAMEAEAIGLCPPGTAPTFAAQGGMGPDGPVPVNPHGGLLSHAHCGGAAGVHHLTEAVRQLRGQAANQVRGAETALVHAEGGILSTHATTILRVP